MESRKKPLCEVPEIGIGNKPIDDGNYLFTEAERDAFIKQEPEAAKYFRPWYGAQEFIHNKPRYCLWLGDSSLADLYDAATMAPELRRAHTRNDAAVLRLYGLPADASEPMIVVHLMNMYKELTTKS